MASPFFPIPFSPIPFCPILLDDSDNNKQCQTCRRLSGVTAAVAVASSHDSGSER